MRSDALYLADILDAIEAIERFVTGFDEARFLADELVQSAVLQKLSIIGEAAAKLSDATRDRLPEIPWKEIIGFRNIAVHAYFSVDWRIVLVTVADDLPMLKRFVDAQVKR
ncbi:MAG: DUF86 domain-containing protein [Sulfuritalea sp.]|jgi:uncharacterized protein with HEPN domain|nr:DUF86 domain-containing protein [Sulfuritalea sp.]MBK9351169.1 DUF86 domain-containing protein [Sulfuritalea sp.]